MDPILQCGTCLYSDGGGPCLAIRMGEETDNVDVMVWVGV